MKPGDELLFLALGGSGEIGMNVNLYGCQGKWIMVDLGMTFADPAVPSRKAVSCALWSTSGCLRRLPQSPPRQTTTVSSSGGAEGFGRFERCFAITLLRVGRASSDALCVKHGRAPPAAPRRSGARARLGVSRGSRRGA